LDFDEKCHFFKFSTIMVTGLGFGLEDTGLGLGLGLEENWPWPWPRTCCPRTLADVFVSESLGDSGVTY